MGVRRPSKKITLRNILDYMEEREYIRVSYNHGRYTSSYTVALTYRELPQLLDCEIIQLTADCGVVQVYV